MLSRCGCNDGQAVYCCRCRDSHTGTLETPVTIDNHQQTQYPPVTGWRCGITDRTRTGVSVGEGYRAVGLHWLGSRCPYQRQLYLLGSCAPTPVQASPPSSPAFENSGLECGFSSSALRRQSCKKSTPLEGMPGFCWTETAMSFTEGTPFFPSISVFLWDDVFLK